MFREDGRMFSNQKLFQLLLPLIIEQTLTALMGTADTMMVARVGDAAVSGVSLVNAVNNMILMVMTALAAGGTICCAQFLGAEERDRANHAAKQVLLCVFTVSMVCFSACLGLHRQILKLIFGSVEQQVMDNAQIYFLITVFSYPFMGLYYASAALYRAAGNSRLPMMVSLVGNAVNLICNALFIFVFSWGARGAALATTASCILQCGIQLGLHKRPGQVIVLGHYLHIRPEWKLIREILRIGIPTGVENGMFQLGRLVVQSTVALLSTAEIAAQALVNTLEYFTSVPAMAVGLGLITVVGQCIGAGREDEAKHYIWKFTGIAELLVIACGILIFALAGTVAALSGLSRESCEILIEMITVITIVKPLIWAPAFTPAYGMRAAGDVKYAMLVSVGSMWLFRIVLCLVLIRGLGFGVIGVWIAMFVDWADRGFWYVKRMRSGKYLHASITV